MATNSDLKKFAQSARRQLREQVTGRLEQVLGIDSVEVREKKSAVDQLKKQIAEHGKAEVIDRVAYTWFNRFCALRYMDANLYNPVRVVSPAPGNVQPELLQEAKAGYLPEEWKKVVDAEKVFGLLNGSIRAENGQQEAYRRLLVGVCNAYARIMPFMFEAIEDYTELLMPQDLLSENAVLTQTRLAMSDEACQDVEVIGWLYQYYISERKDEVFEQAKKGKKIEAGDIPAVTQLFTPHWIVRYLVENSLGRLWLLNHPDSKIIQHMDYFIKPLDEETDYLKVSSPEELKVCDPACGSGHMLTYAFDLLYAIYEEQGYDPIKIPPLILEKNLYGIEIDARAGALAAFALAMKARGKDKRFFTRGLQPNVCVLENVSFSDQELKEYMNAVGRDLFTDPLLQTLKQFEQAKNFGSLIQPVLTNPAYIRQVLAEKNLVENLFLFGIHEKVLKVLKQSEYLSPRYQVVVANPPYMGISNANEELKDHALKFFPKSKSDLFSMFIERNTKLIFQTGFVGMITMQSWMFLSTFEEFRNELLSKNSILSLLHLGPHAFDSIGGEVVSTCVFVLSGSRIKSYHGIFQKLLTGKNESEKQKIFFASKPVENVMLHKNLFIAQNDDFSRIPGFRIIYWIKGLDLFSKKLISDGFISGGRNKTHNDENYLRFVWEIASNSKRWKMYAKGGEYRKYYGNEIYVVDWSLSSREEYESHGGLCNSRFWNKLGITWSLTSTKPSFRVKNGASFYSSAAPTIFNNDFSMDFQALGFLNSKVAEYYLAALNPTLSTTVGDVFALPYGDIVFPSEIGTNVSRLIELHQLDWNRNEIVPDFEKPELNNSFQEGNTISNTISLILGNYKKEISCSKKLEEEINQFLINSYNLQNELSFEITLEDITLTCNPHYRYGSGKTEGEYERLQGSDIIKEFISYSVGCMFGRFSLENPGLILANQGETLQDYLRQVPDPTFLPDEDNVIPVIGGDWFQDDITERFKKFLKVTFGEEHYSENLQFIEETIGRDIEAYFLKDFYDYHIKMYKKRPIYWMFSSPKGTFNALIYMHRYTKDTVSILLNDYLKQFRVKLESRKTYVEKLSISASGSQRERTVALKELETLKKQLEEITTYENKVIFPLATKQIEIDLDDGVKANYPKFGEALVPIKGLE